MAKGGGLEKWEAGGGFLLYSVIYKYIKYAIKIVNSFPLHLLQKLLLEECSLNPDKRKRFLSLITMKMASAFVLFLLHH